MDDIAVSPAVIGEHDEHGDGAGELLPTLWSRSAPQADMLDFIPHVEFVPGRMAIGLAVVRTTPTGHFGLDHVTHHQAAGADFDELLTAATANLVDGLRIGCCETDDGELFVMDRRGGLVDSAVALPDFHEQLSGIVGSDELVVALSCPEELVIAPAATALADQLHSAVLGSTIPAGPVVPSLLLVDATGVHLLAERR
jgi:hypothetical protein